MPSSATPVADGASRPPTSTDHAPTASDMVFVSTSAVMDSGASTATAFAKTRAWRAPPSPTGPSASATWVHSFVGAGSAAKVSQFLPASELVHISTEVPSSFLARRNDTAEALFSLYSVARRPSVTRGFAAPSGDGFTQKPNVSPPAALGETMSPWAKAPALFVAFR